MEALRPGIRRQRVDANASRGRALASHRCGRASEAYSRSDAPRLPLALAANDGISRGPPQRTPEDARSRDARKPLCLQTFGLRNRVQGVARLAVTGCSYSRTRPVTTGRTDCGHRDRRAAARGYTSSWSL